MKRNSAVTASFNGLRLRRLHGLYSGKAILHTIILALLISSLWAVPAFAAEDAVADAGDTAVVADEAVTAAADPADGGGATEAEAATAAVEPEGDPEGDAEAPVTAAAEPEAPEAVAADEAVAAGDFQLLDEPCEDCNDGVGQPLDEECEDLKAILELLCGEGEFGIFWASKEDYEAGLLSMEYRLTNTSTDTAVNNLRVVSATANNGVKVNDDLPKPLGSLGPGEWMYFILKWQVPKGVRHFVTDISICGDCEQLCVDCEPEPVCEENCDPPIDEEKQPPVDEEVQPPVVESTPVVASALPSTGLDLTLPLVFGLGIALIGGLLPTVKKAYRRKR